MKKSRLTALLITVAMVITSTVSIPAYAQGTATPDSAVGNTTGEWENKLGDPIYAEILNNADENEKFMTIIRIPDMADHEAIEKEAQSITGINEENYDTISESEYNEELAKWSSEDEELLKNASNPEDMKKSIIDGRIRENKANRFARIVNQLTADVYTKENAKILAKLGVAEEDIVDYGTDLPEPILMLTKSEIERIAEFDDVKCIDLDIFHDLPQIEEVVEWEDKLGDPIYAEILNNAYENEKFMTIVGITDMVDNAAIEQEAIRITGIDIEEFDTISESDYNALCSMQRQLAEEFYLNENSKILSKLAVADEDVVTIDTHSASLTLNLTKSEIERIAAFNDVKTINLDIPEEDMPVYEDTSPYNRKIDRDSLVPLLEKAEEGEKFTVWVWVVDRAKDEAICAQVRSRMIADGSWENHTNPEYDNWDDTSKMISDSRRLQDEVYKQENPKIAAALELADEDIIEIGTQDPIFTLNLTSSEIERIAESEYVTHIDYIDLDAVGTVDEDQGEGYNPNTVTDEQKKTYNAKIDPDELVPMLEKAEEGDKFTVWVWVVDKAKDEAICAQVRSRMIADGSWQDYSDPKLDASEATDIMIMNDRKLQKAVYTQENPKIAEALELADEDIIEIGTQDPIFTLNLTSSEIERIAESEYVTHIDYIDLDAVDEVQETLDEAKRDISETTVFLNNVEDTSKYGGLEITEIAMTYTGSPVTLNIVVKDGDKTLEENVDYTAEYRNNINTGAAYLDIIGIGGYKGKRSYHFAIMNAVMFGKQGDADGDGEITSNDALILLRGSIDNKKFSESEMALCDMDKDGIITSNDALLVLRMSVGLD